MYIDTVKAMAGMAKKKAAFLERSKLSYLIASGLAGAYVGLGIVLILAIGAPIAASSGGAPFLKMIMGVSFGIALTLVIFAGSELFTGNNMIMTLGVAKKTVGMPKLFKVWGFSWVGNLLGSMALAAIVYYSGSISEAGALVEKIATKKMNMPIQELLLKGILCNWLVCLAIWCAARSTNDVAKCILIFWCLFAFISSGYEHSIANMTLLTISLLGEHSDKISWNGFSYNLLWVTIGNIIGGGFFVGGLYALATRKEEEPKES